MLIIMAMITKKNANFDRFLQKPRSLKFRECWTNFLLQRCKPILVYEIIRIRVLTPEGRSPTLSKAIISDQM
jgi:hypothetical protein